MGRPKKKRKPARRRKSVNEGSAPVDRNEPKNWGGPDELPGGRKRKQGRSSLVIMHDAGTLTNAQLSAACDIQKAYSYIGRMFEVRVAHYDGFGGADVGVPDWFEELRRPYEEFMNKHKDLSFTAKVIYSMVIGERTLVETGVRVGAKADQVKSCLRSALSDFATIRARWKLEELPSLSLSDLERIEG